jgi:hypothetical protein
MRRTVCKELVVLSFLVDAVDLAWVVRHLGLHLPGARPVFPGFFPQLVAHVRVFGCSFVAFRARLDFVFSESLGG